MNASVKPQDKQDQAAANGAAGAKAIVNGVGEAVDAVTGAVSGKPADSKDKPEKAKDSGTGIGGFFGDLWDSIKEFFSNFKENGSIGSILGGILGLGGAWLAGNFFGGGIMSTILMVALAVPLMLVGSDTIGGWINGALGTSKTDSAQKSSEPARTREVAQGAAPQTSAAVEQTNGRAASSTPTLTFNNEELLAMVNPTNGQPDTNTRDRLEIFVDPNDTTRRLQVRPVADSVADRPGIITLAALREQVGSSATGIVFGQALNGVVSVQAAPIGALPGAPAAQGRA